MHPSAALLGHGLVKKAIALHCLTEVSLMHGIVKTSSPALRARYPGCALCRWTHAQALPCKDCCPQSKQALEQSCRPVTKQDKHNAAAPNFMPRSYV